MLQNLGYYHLPILLIVPLSSVFGPNKRPPSFNFQKARWADFSSYFDSHCPSAEEYSSFSLSSAAALFTSLAPNAAKASISFGRIKRHPKAWWSTEVEGAVSERRKAFAAAHRSDEDCQAYISASRRPLLVIAKAKAEALQTTCSSLSPRSNPKSAYSLLRSIAGSSSSSSSSSNFPNCSSPRKSALVYTAYMRSHFPLLSQRPCAAEPEATSLSSAELRVLRSFTRPSDTFLSYSLNSFLAQPSTRLKQIKTYIIFKVSDTTPASTLHTRTNLTVLYRLFRPRATRLLGIISTQHREPALRLTALSRQAMFKTNV